MNLFKSPLIILALLVALALDSYGNSSPSGDAGENQTLTIGGSPIVGTLQGSATDDGLPYGLLFYNWSQLSGPTATFNNTRFTAETDVTFSEAGVYTFELRVFDGEITSINSVSITVEQGEVEEIVDNGSDNGNDNGPEESIDVPDSDQDGILDEWEQTHFGDLNTVDENTDVDGDGTLDLHESWLELDPNNGSEFLSLSIVWDENGQSALVFPSKDGLTFKIYSHTDLNEDNLNNWTQYEVTDQDGDTYGDLIIDTPDFNPNVACFFKVEVISQG